MSRLIKKTPKWLQNAVKTYQGYRHPVTGELLKCFQGLAQQGAPAGVTVDVTYQDAVVVVDTPLLIIDTATTLVGQAPIGSTVTVTSATNVVLGTGIADSLGDVTVTLNRSMVNDEVLTLKATLNGVDSIDVSLTVEGIE